MKIEKISSRAKKFGILKTGDIFLYSDRIWIKSSEINNEKARTNCIDLKNGYYNFVEDDVTIHVPKEAILKYEP